MNRCVALAGVLCAACLSPPGEGEGEGEGDGAPGATDGGALAADDAAPCPAEFRDDFDRTEVGEAWVFAGDSDDTTRVVDGDSLTITANAATAFTWGALRTAVSWNLADVVIEAHVDPTPSTDGDTFFGWVNSEGGEYTGIAAVNDSYIAGIEGVIGGEYTALCSPVCPGLQAGPQRWRVRPHDTEIVFELSVGGDEWQELGPRLVPTFPVGRPILWAESAVGLASAVTAQVVTVSSCD